MIITGKITGRKRGFRVIAIIAANSDTRKQIVERRQLMPRTKIKSQQPLPFHMATALNFCCVPKMKLVGWQQEQTEVWHMAHFWVSYGICTMPGSPMRWSEGSSRRWTG